MSLKNMMAGGHHAHHDLNNTMSKIFTIRRAYSSGLFTIRIDERPSIIAFKSKKSASRFVAMEKSTWSGKQQPICIDKMPMESLCQRCSFNSLPLVVYDDDGAYNVFYGVTKSTDEMQYHFENVIRYMSE